MRNLSDIIKNARSIVFFGGAGVSTESGMKDFRSANGIYAEAFEMPPEEMISGNYLKAYPEKFFSFYRRWLLPPEGVRPNAAHYKLAEMERAGILKAVITQNVDGLHQEAGSKNVLELHGSVHRNYCLRCGEEYDMAFVRDAAGVPLCACGGTVRPRVVLYNESLDERVLDAAIDAIAAADVLIVAGTSLAVYPAAGLIRYFRGKELVLINKTPTPLDEQASLVIHAPVGETLSKVDIE